MTNVIVKAMVSHLDDWPDSLAFGDEDDVIVLVSLEDSNSHGKGINYMRDTSLFMGTRCSGLLITVLFADQYIVKKKGRVVNYLSKMKSCFELLGWSLLLHPTNTSSTQIL